MNPKPAFPNILEKISEWFFSSSGEQELVVTFLKFGSIIFIVLLVLFIIFAKVLNARDRF